MSECKCAVGRFSDEAEHGAPAALFTIMDCLIARKRGRFVHDEQCYTDVEGDQLGARLLANIDGVEVLIYVVAK